MSPNKEQTKQRIIYLRTLLNDTDAYRKKYLKYKEKYLQLKTKLN